MTTTGRPLSEKLAQYENAEFTVATATTDYDVAANQTKLFGGATSKMVGTKGRGVVRIITDQTITVKYNISTNDGITITSSMSPYEESDLEIFNLYITNTSGNTASLKVLCKTI